KFKQYDKELGFYIGESDLPSDNPEWGNTEVELPGEIGQGHIFAFDESIQMWRSYTADQWEAYLEKKTTPILTDDDQWRISITKQVTGLTQQNSALTQTVGDLTKRVMALETKETSNEGNV
ncbi:hypothetical protein, partial [uncultured Weissella sp.]